MIYYVYTGGSISKAFSRSKPDLMHSLQMLTIWLKLEPCAIVPDLLLQELHTSDSKIYYIFVDLHLSVCVSVFAMHAKTSLRIWTKVGMGFPTPQGVSVKTLKFMGHPWPEKTAKNRPLIHFFEMWLHKPPSFFTGHTVPLLFLLFPHVGAPMIKHIYVKILLNWSRAQACNRGL